MHDILLWMLCALLTLVFLAVNWANIRLWFSFGQPEPQYSGSSPILMVGGIAGALALLAAPHPRLAEFFWLPLLVDLGTGPYLLVVVLALLMEGLRSGRWLDRVPFLRYLGGASRTPSTVTESALQRAITGCILGTAVGDAIGLPYEGLSKTRQHKMVKDIHGHHLFFGKGFASDDTEHTCMLAQSLIGAGNWHADYLEKKFLSNFAWRLRFWLLALPAGIGMATLKSIVKLWLGFPPRYSGVASAGNAPAMRSALLGVCYGHDVDKMKMLTRAATRISHTDRDAEHGALAVALAAHLAATRRLPVSATEYLQTFQELVADGGNMVKLVGDVCDSINRGESLCNFARRIGCAAGVSGYSCHSVPVALHVWLMHQHDYRDGIVNVVRLGGDTDTTAAMVGAMTGAGVGKTGIPEKWLTDLWEWPHTVTWMERLSAALAENCANGTNGGAPFANPLAVLFRNGFFMLVVLSHGLRRLLPPYRMLGIFMYKQVPSTLCAAVTDAATG